MGWFSKITKAVVPGIPGAQALAAPLIGAGVAAGSGVIGYQLAKNKKPSSSNAQSGGTETASGSGSGPSPEETIRQILSQYLNYNPQVAGQQYDLTAKYAPKYAALNRGMISSERTAGIDDVERLAPRLQGIREAGSRSDIRSMRDQLYAAILGDLSMGENLTAEQDRNAVQSVRSAQAARGLNGGQSGANIEAVRRALSGQALGQQRRAAASSVLASEASQTPDPFATILGMPTTSTSAAINQAGAGNNALSPSMLSTAFFGATQANQAANQYNLALEIAKQNPYLYKS
jgi:hypothetical protein